MIRSVLVVWCAAAFIGLGTSTVASAQGLPDQRTFFTFSGTVEVPGATLPAGKYLFRLPNPETAHSVVQILSGDGKKVYGMFFSRPIERTNAASDPEVRFMETAAGTPPAIRTWWYPGMRSGHEFVYPKEQARRLAKRSHQPVLTTAEASTTTTEANTQELSRVSESGEETKVNDDAKAEPAAPAGVIAQGQLADNSSTFTPVASDAPLVARRHLPRTASSMPGQALGGVLALLAGLALRSSRRRTWAGERH